MTLLLSCNLFDDKPAIPAVGFDNNSSKEVQIPDSVLSKIRLCTEIPISEADLKKRKGKSAGGVINLIWPIKSKVLLVKFLDGDIALREKVQMVAKEWEEHCGKKFDFGNHKEPDIAITFKYSGSWSRIGKDSRTEAIKNRPSMNFGWLTLNSTDEEVRRVVLHEFGHALGLIHEHQNPNNNPIQWNYAAVYQYYKLKQNWDEAKVQKNIFSKYTNDQLNSSDFDSKSIMLYEIQKELTADGYTVKGNSELSPTDKAIVRQLYPSN